LRSSIDSYRDKLIVTLLYSTGMRVGEFTKLRVEDIDFSERFIRIPPENSKTGEGRTIFVPPVNLYFEETGGSLTIETRPRTRLRDIQAMWSVITNQFGNKKKNYPLRNLERDLRIRELSQKKKEENAKIVDELGDGDIVPSEIDPTTDEGIATNLNIIDLSAGREDTKRGKDIVKQARKRFNDRIQKMGSG